MTAPKKGPTPLAPAKTEGEELSLIIAALEDLILLIRSYAAGGAQIVVRPGDEEIRISVDERDTPRP